MENQMNFDLNYQNDLNFENFTNFSPVDQNNIGHESMFSHSTPMGEFVNLEPRTQHSIPSEGPVKSEQKQNIENRSNGQIDTLNSERPNEPNDSDPTKTPQKLPFKRGRPRKVHTNNNDQIKILDASLSLETNAILSNPKRNNCPRIRTVNGAFDQLREFVPSGTIKKNKISKVETLRSAMEYIKALQEMLGIKGRVVMIIIRLTPIPIFNEHGEKIEMTPAEIQQEQLQRQQLEQAKIAEIERKREETKQKRAKNKKPNKKSSQVKNQQKLPGQKKIKFNKLAQGQIPGPIYPMGPGMPGPMPGSFGPGPIPGPPGPPFHFSGPPHPPMPPFLPPAPGPIPYPNTMPLPNLGNSVQYSNSNSSGSENFSPPQKFTSESCDRGFFESNVSQFY